MDVAHEYRAVLTVWSSLR